MTSVLTSPSTMTEACDEIAEELLAEAGWENPPVDAFALAAELGYEIAFDARQQSRGRFKRLGGRPTMFLSPDDRPERLHWAAAHEIGESAAVRVFDRLDLDAHQVPEDVRERIASQLAGALLLPRSVFAEDVRSCDGDVCLLKAKYATASHELILMSQLRMEPLLLASVFDHGELTRRRTNGRLSSPPLMTVERQAQLRAHATGRPVTITGRGVRVQAWPVHETGWKRELLRTTPLDLEEPDETEIEYESPGCYAE